MGIQGEHQNTSPASIRTEMCEIAQGTIIESAVVVKPQDSSDIPRKRWQHRVRLAKHNSDTAIRFVELKPLLALRIVFVLNAQHIGNAKDLVKESEVAVIVRAKSHVTVGLYTPEGPQALKCFCKHLSFYMLCRPEVVVYPPEVLVDHAPHSFS